MNMKLKLFIINATLIGFSVFMLLSIYRVNQTLSQQRQLTVQINLIQSNIIQATDVASIAFKYNDANKDVFSKLLDTAQTEIKNVVESRQLSDYSATLASTINLNKQIANTQLLYLNLSQYPSDKEHNRERHIAISHLQDKILNQLHQELKLTFLIQQQLGIQSTQAAYRINFLIISIVIMVTGFISALIWLVISNMKSGINRLRKVTDNALDEQFSETDIHTTNNELSVFARELQAMIASFQKLTIKKSELDLIVKSRTVELEELSNTDSLTGIRNRRQLKSIANTELARAERFKHSLSIALIDIDLFKQVNDTYGHDCGDSVLIELCQLISAQLREHDYFFRYGGEEFLLILPESDLVEASKLVERLRVAVEVQKFQCEGNSLSVTISAGITSLCESRKSLRELLPEADRLMYQAKINGRNSVMF